jgi:hypothetical protein
MFFIFSAPLLIRHLWQLKTVVFLHVLFYEVFLSKTVLFNLKIASMHSVIHFQSFFRYFHGGGGQDLNPLP